MAIIRAIHQSLIFFGGVPKEIIIDNSRQMVITHEKDGIVRYNDNFLKFLGIMGITPDACIPYRARTKGKIERPFYHIQEHLLKGCEVGDLQEFDRRLSAYTDSINKTIHTTIKDTPKCWYRHKGMYGTVKGAFHTGTKAHGGAHHCQ